MSQLCSRPPAASDFAGRVDTLLWTMTAATGLVALGIVVLIIAFSLRYRRARQANRHPSNTSSVAALTRHPEIAWIGIPLLIFLTFYVWGARLYFDYETAPATPM